MPPHLARLITFAAQAHTFHALVARNNANLWQAVRAKGSQGSFNAVSAAARAPVTGLCMSAGPSSGIPANPAFEYEGPEWFVSPGLTLRSTETMGKEGTSVVQTTGVMISTKATRYFVERVHEYRGQGCEHGPRLDTAVDMILTTAKRANVQKRTFPRGIYDRAEWNYWPVIKLGPEEGALVYWYSKEIFKSGTAASAEAATATSMATALRAALAVSPHLIELNEATQSVAQDGPEWSISPGNVTICRAKMMGKSGTLISKVVTTSEDEDEGKDEEIDPHGYYDDDGDYQEFPSSSDDDDNTSDQEETNKAQVKRYFVDDKKLDCAVAMVVRTAEWTSLRRGKPTFDIKIGSGDGELVSWEGGTSEGMAAALKAALELSPHLFPLTETA